MSDPVQLDGAREEDLNTIINGSSTDIAIIPPRSSDNDSPKEIEDSAEAGKRPK